MSIDKLLTAAARSGSVTALTIWPSGSGWQCNARYKSGGWVCVTASDPVDGAIKALTGTPKMYGMATDAPETDVFG